MPSLQLAALYLLAISMIAIGILHFVRTMPFVHIVPKYLPAPLALVYISGFFEYARGLRRRVTMTDGTVPVGPTYDNGNGGVESQLL